MNNIKSLRENILSALPLSMAKKYEKMNRRLNTDKKSDYYIIYKPIFDKVFGKTDKGKPIYRKYINIDNMKVDKEIEQFLKDNGYSISEEEFNAGIIIKNKDDKNNKYSLDELKKKGMVLRIGRILNKKKAPQNLILKWDKISKEISNKKLIVISRHPYDIAGQSTDRAWQSCMTLPTDKQSAGCNSRFVDSGIKAGVLIAYLININDTNINKPLARVLIKPYTNYDESEIEFKVSNIYGTAGFEFQNAVQKWVNKNLNSRHIKVDENMRDLDLHLDTTNIYNDEDEYDDYDEFEYIITKEEIINKMKELSNDKIKYKFDEVGTISDRGYYYYLDFIVYKYVNIDEILSILNLQIDDIDYDIDILYNYKEIDFSLYNENINTDELSSNEIYDILKETLENYIKYNPNFEDCDKFTQHILYLLIDSYVLNHNNRNNDGFADTLFNSIDLDLDYSEDLLMRDIDVEEGDNENIYCISASVRIVGSVDTAYDEFSENFFKFDDYGNYSDWAFDGVKPTRDEVYYDYTYEI